jgi:threonyl-tRNA synthetase
MKEQIESEILKFLEFLEEVYEDFGFKKPTYYLSLRPENRTGDDEMWDYSESVMKNILESSNMDFSVQSGEGAFYGPKIDITVPDALGREWQLGTVQLDFFASGKFGLNYINQDGEKEDVVLIHRAIFGSLERFFGILIEHFGGSFPLWLAPEQYTVIPISEDHFEDCKIIEKSLSLMGLRGKVDLSSDRFNNKIRKAQKMKIPLMIIIGNNEVENSSLTIRLRNGENLNDVKIKTLEKISKTNIKINDDEGIKLAFIKAEEQNE